MITGGKSKYVCLLSLIKAERRSLYDIICDLCLDGTFRSSRYQNTFLMPSEKLVKHIEQLVDKDEDVKAIDVIRSLLLKGHLSAKDFKTGANIGTLQFGSFVLAEPDVVGKNLSDSKKSVITTREGAFATFVLDFKSDTPPKTIEGKSGGMTLVNRASGGNGGVNESAVLIKDITQRLIVRDNADATIDNFFKAVSGILIGLQRDHPERFVRAKYYLAANPILSWFFLTMPGHSDPLAPIDMLKDFQWQAVSDLSIIKEAENVDYTINKELLKKIKSQRTHILNKGDRASLVKMIGEAYHGLVKDAHDAGAVDSMLATNVQLKMLMDEIRFVHEDAMKTWAQMDDTFDTLGMVNWSNPKASMVICDCDTYEKHLTKGVEALMSGPMTFVKSIYFMYVPLTETIEDQLIKGMAGGAILGGNPANINNVIFTGGAARAQLQKKCGDLKLTSIVKMLSKQQRDALKGML
jgi:hypothetical protein